MSPSSLGDWLREGRYVDVLLSEPAAALIAEFVAVLRGQQLAGAAPASSESESGSGPGSGPALLAGCERDVDGGSKITTGSPDAGTSSSSSSSSDRVAVGLAALNAFLQANVTGPPLDGRALRALQQRFLTFSAAAAGPEPQPLTRVELGRACRRALEVDGVECYEHVPLVEVFCLARHLLLLPLRKEEGAEAGAGGVGEAAGDGDRAARSAAWLALRVNVWHYKLLTQPSLGPGSVFNRSASWCDVPSLQAAVEKGLEQVEGEVWAGEGWSTQDRVRFLVEKANVCIMLGQDAKAREALRRATELSGFVYALSGALGKRTRFQQKSTSQLVVLAKSGQEAQTEDLQGNQAKPQALALNDDTLLETVEFTKEEDGRRTEAASELPPALNDLPPDDQPQLAPEDQIILLAEATLKDAFSPADSLTSEEILPFAVRVIGDKSTNWQIYTHALLVRSRIEVHRSRTVERGVLQMQAVVDQVIVDTAQSAEQAQQPEQDGGASASIPQIQITQEGDEGYKPAGQPTSFFPAPKPTETAPAQARLEYIHALSSPPRWHLETELAYAWTSVGSLVSALEIFKRLRLWAEVALCFASAAARDDEDGRGISGEAKAKAVLRWRLFRRTGTPLEQADASGAADEEVDLDRLKEADFRGPERHPPPPNAPRLWCILGDLENDPVHYERAWEISKHRFARAQKSLGEYYLQQKDLSRARDAYKKAVAVNRLSSELWNRLGDICLRLGDFSDAAEAFGRAIASSGNAVGGEDARTWSNLGSALYSLYVERVKELKQRKEQPKPEETSTSTTQKAEDENDDEDESTSPATTPAAADTAAKRRDDPATLLAQSLAAYKRGAAIARDNWRIWDNVITLAARLRPLPVPDLLQALRELVRIRRIDASERAWRAAVGGTTGVAVSGGGGGGGGGDSGNWLEDAQGWKTVVDRTDELVSLLENYGAEVAEIGPRWKGKARSAVRSVMGKAKESWEGSAEWERLVALLEGL
ncbi:uncharacterized protein THITE_2116265, partial [Thermothielavioides terrestris NRRL 8126]